MNLPAILDVAIGLVFIYLILSLLASEIQEIIATLFQWRAVHLKKSIEILLSGGKPRISTEELTPEEKAEEKAVERIVNDLYENPLIKNINQQAKKGIDAHLRKITSRFADFGQGRHTGPSYIPAETFSTTLLIRLGVPSLIDKITWLRLTKVMNDEVFRPLRETTNALPASVVSESTVSLLHDRLTRLETRCAKILNNFKEKRINLVSAISLLKTEIEKLNTPSLFDTDSVNQTEFEDELAAIIHDVFGSDAHHSELIARIRPDLSKVMEVIQQNGAIFDALHQEIERVEQDKDSPLYQTLSAACLEIKGDIKDIAEKFPGSVRDSLAALAASAQIKADTVEQELTQFKQEIEVWFDRSMERASGVYKRNAKGVAILIGLSVAAISNADSFYIVSRLASDNALQTAIANSASQVASSPSEIAAVKTELDRALADVNLPIGWTTTNICQQSGFSPQNARNRATMLRALDYSQICTATGTSRDGVMPTGDRRLLFMLSRFPGWLLSGIAIAMGAPFWFDVLNRFINVRNTGKKPPASTEKAEKSAS
jgi:hypothetical protein